MKKYIYIVLCSAIFYSCVTTKKYLVNDLESNFKLNKEKFYEKKGLNDKPEYKIEVTYDDNNLSQDYDVLSYNKVKSIKPFLIFYKNYWFNNKRIFQILHYGYCNGLIEHSDGVIIEPDLGAFKYVRYKNSSKPQYVEPEKEKFSKFISIGGGIDRSESGGSNIIGGNGYLYTNVGLSLERKIDCFSCYTMFFFEHTWYILGKIGDLNKCSFFCRRCLKRPFYSFNFFYNHRVWFFNFFN